MIRHRLRWIVLAMLAALGMSIVVPGVAAAVEPETDNPVSVAEYEIDYAKKHSLTDHGRYCFEAADEPIGSGSTAVACFQGYGDVLWIWDTKPDGHRVSIEWSTSYKEREGTCINKLGSSARWTRCNKDFKEGTVISMRIKHYVGGEWDYTKWHQIRANDNG